MATIKAIVIGFPKSGTTTIHVASKRSGLKSAHQIVGAGVRCGQLIYRRYLNGEDPLADFGGFDILSQMDICRHRSNFWPNLDIPLLLTIRKYHPNCVFILNLREPSAIVSSITRWNTLRERITKAEVPGLPRGFGKEDTHLIQWIESHYAACRAVFGNDPKFLELDITDPEAPLKLGKALGVEIKWWGVANQNKKATDVMASIS